MTGTSASSGTCRISSMPSMSGQHQVEQHQPRPLGPDDAPQGGPLPQAGRPFVVSVVQHVLQKGSRRSCRAGHAEYRDLVRQETSFSNATSVLLKEARKTFAKFPLECDNVRAGGGTGLQPAPPRHGEKVGAHSPCPPKV